MSSPETNLLADEPVRPLKRVEYERLAAEGYFADEHVELLFGMVVPMTPSDPAHSESTYRLASALRRGLGERARVREQNPLAASDISEPEPDIAVVANVDYWTEHPARAFLVVEVAHSSVRKDRGAKAQLYALAEVDEYWIVNLAEAVVEVCRDRHAGTWRQRSVHGRGDTIAMLAFPDVRIAVSEILPPASPPR